MAYSVKSVQEIWVEQISTSMKSSIVDIVVEYGDSSSKNKTLCILAVPETFTIDNPEAYTPQKLGLGPYHHFRDDVYKMEWDKVSTVKSALNEDQIGQFHNLVVDKIKPLYAVIHSFYGNFFNYDADTFAWMFTVDGLFLLVQIYSMKKEFVRDIIMLENQIPFLVLNTLQNSLQLFKDHGEDDDSFSNKLIKFCEEVTPLELTQDSRFRVHASRMHLLDLLYELIVNNVSNKEEKLSEQETITSINEIKVSIRRNFWSRKELGFVLCCRHLLGYVRFVTSLPWREFLHMFGKKDDEQSAEEKINAQEITIPSVSQLHDIANVEFIRVQGGIKNIEFNKEQLTFYLPTITLNENTEVLLRNLVAYEAIKMKSSDILQFAEYVDLMCGIIDKPRDVELLKKRGIVNVKGHMEDQDIANLFNGIKRSTWDRKRKHILEKDVAKVNERFSNSAQVKIYQFMKKHVYGSWKFLTILATVVLLILTAFQSFCDVYDCSDHFF